MTTLQKFTSSEAGKPTH